MLCLGFLFSGCGVRDISGLLEEGEEVVQTIKDILPGKEDNGPEEESGSGSDLFSELFSLLDPGRREEYQDLLPEGESLFRNAAETGYYYTCLTGIEQEIYMALLAVTKDPTSMEYRKGVHTTEDPESEQFTEEIALAYQALIFDHPERFWFRKESGIFGYAYASRPDRDGVYTVMFRLTMTYPEYEQEMTRFNEAVDAFLADIDLTQPQPYVALAIHDKLIDTVTYDSGLKDCYPESDGSGFDYGYTAYGALVANSRGEAHTAVCDGYSYAYEYLLQQAGIEVTRVGGLAGDSPGEAQPHSWNLVCLDGDWYEVDATWDDVDPRTDPDDPAYDLFQAAMNDGQYWELIRHHLFNLTTEEMAYFEPDDSYIYYTDRGYVTFLDSSVHIRDTWETAEEEDSLSYLAPAAEGTAYSYENLISFG